MTVAVMPAVVRFGSYRLDRDGQQLWRRDRRIPLRPKTWAVLDYLAARPGRLVTKDELLATVWKDVVVTEGVLAKSVRELRLALRDDVARPRFIETAHGRGFRFIADLDVTADAPAQPAASSVVGRDAELALLAQYLAGALGGTREVVFVTGEPGIGKTALVEAFTATLPPGTRVAHGQCVEQHGAGEAYMPLLEALARLAAQPDGERLVAILGRHAPTWLAELPGLGRDATRRAAGPSPGRMVRELATALEAFTGDTPLVLVLEDLHWGDVSTVDALAAVAQRTERARLLVLGTYRPVDAIVHGNPIVALRPQLAMRQRCRELPLGFLDEAAIDRWLRGRLPGPPVATLASTLHRLTDGNALFTVALVDYVVAQSMLVERDGAWDLAAGVGTGTLPDSLRDAIEHQLGLLSPDQLAVLEAASVVGDELTTQSLAAATGRDLEALDDVCLPLARRGQMIRALGGATWPDGSAGTRYGFVHALYRSALYDRVPPARRRRMHAAVAERLERGHAGVTPDVAAELASHFERGGDHEQAARYMGELARRAVGRGAHREAIAALTHASALLATLDETQDRARLQLELHLALGVSQQAVLGFGDAAVRETFDGVRVLAERLGEAPTLFYALVGRWSHHLVRGEPRAALEVADRADVLTADAPPPTLEQLWAHLRPPIFRGIADTMSGMTRFALGELAPARRSLEAAVAALPPGPAPTLVDFRAVALGQLAQVCATMGDVDAGRHLLGQAEAQAQATDSPVEVVRVLQLVGQFHMLLGDRDAALAAVERGLALASEHGFTMWRLSLYAVACWADPSRADAMQQTLAEVRALGVLHQQPLFLAAAAEMDAAQGRCEAGFAAIASALEIIERGERRHEAELHRARARLSSAAGRDDDAEVALQQAIAVARAQGALLYELRAVEDLARLWDGCGRRDEARTLLAPMVERFPDGADVPHVEAARRTLAMLAG
jgi:DNA-binding winged helix-turn-helix (wHTH) protein/tetratricopeptide (TPR) repeat protein